MKSIVCLLLVFASVLAAQSRGPEMASKIRYDNQDGLLTWEVHEAVPVESDYRKGKKLFDCRIDFKIPEMKCGKKRYGFATEEANLVEGIVERILGAYIKQCMQLFHNGGMMLDRGYQDHGYQDHERAAHATRNEYHTQEHLPPRGEWE